MALPFLSPSPAAEGLSAEPGSDVLDQFQSLWISLPPQSRLVCLPTGRTPRPKPFAFLAVRLKDLRKLRTLKRVLITSTIPQEGKSMISANLACALAYASDARILLVDGDLRRPTLPQMFGIQKQPGIYEWLRDDREVFQTSAILRARAFGFCPRGTLRAIH